jgi:hypothetical protein
MSLVAAFVVAGGAGEEVLGLVFGGLVETGLEPGGGLAAHGRDDMAAPGDEQLTALGHPPVEGIVVKAHEHSLPEGGEPALLVSPVSST